MKLLRAWLMLLWMSFERLLWSVNTLMVLFPLLASGLLVLRLQSRVLRRAEVDFADAFDWFSGRFVLVVFVAFVIPICSLAYGTTSIGGDREDRTLLFLLIRPVPRYLVLLAKLLATLPLVLGLVVGSFYINCQIAGDVGRLAFQQFLPPVFYMTLAYVCLFHLFAVAFRHATIIALLYAIFMELFLGNMPGIVKRVAVNYYGRSMIYSLGAEGGLEVPSTQWFEPISAQAAAWALLGIAAGGLLLAIAVFQRREYRDLT